MLHTKNRSSNPGHLPGYASITEDRSVVLVEHDVDNRESIAEALEAEGFNVHSLATADEALELLDAPRCPPLILLDLWMPRMSGRDLLAAVALRPDRDRFRIVLIAADSEAHGLAVRPGVVEVLPKPFALNRLLDAVRRYA